MGNDKKRLKDDINFLEYPNWAVNPRGDTNKLVIEKENGRYEIIAPLGLPSHFDKTVLYYLLHRAYKESGFTKYSIVVNRHQIAKNVFFGVKSIGKNKYDRIMSSLKRWTVTAIDFEGLFFEKDEYTSRYFHVIDEVVLKKESGELLVRLNEGYVKQLCETKFCKWIDFEQYKKLSRASSARLYEILVKSFKTSIYWKIHIKKLAEKLTFGMREHAKTYYPSDVLRHLKPAVNEINRNTELHISLRYNKDTGICIFEKLEKPKEQFIPAVKAKVVKKKEDLNKKHIAQCLEYFIALPIEEQKAIVEDIKRQPFLAYVPDRNTRIFAYMTRKKLWSAEVN